LSQSVQMYFTVWRNQWLESY